MNVERNRKISKRQRFFIQNGGIVKPLCFAPIDHANFVQIATRLETRIVIFFIVSLFII